MMVFSYVYSNNYLTQAFIFEQYLQSGWATGYSFVCEPCDFSTSPKAMRVSKHYIFIIVNNKYE
jgi:hypothetical protein